MHDDLDTSQGGIACADKGAGPDALSSVRADLAGRDGALPQVVTGFERIISRCEDSGRGGLEIVHSSGAAGDRLEDPSFLLCENALRAEDSAMQLRMAGHMVEVFVRFEDLMEAVETRATSAVILDLEYSKEMLARLACVVAAREAAFARFPVVWISTHHHFEASLLAARTGVDFYLTRPLDFPGLSERLHRFAISRGAAPYRLLVVADNQARTEPYVTLLREARMEVRRLDRLRNLLQVMDDYRPEVVVTDIDLPRCSNTDVSRLIRQRMTHFDVPIVFLSSDVSVAARARAAQAGADDLVGKPLEPAHFVSMLQNRAERHRALRALIMRDSLTGLYNHAALKESLRHELARCARDRLPLSLTMIDIDFFKKVNDSYGHPVGDQVIRSLSSLLRRRLRGVDIVGRYGGEEFAAILPGTSDVDAAVVLDRIRETFSALRHQADTREFTASFSAGVVDTGKYADAEELLAAADSALYVAKRHGRNRIEIG